MSLITVTSIPGSYLEPGSSTDRSPRPRAPVEPSELEPSSSGQWTLPLLHVVCVWSDSGGWTRGASTVRLGEGGRIARRQGGLGRRTGPGTRISPRSPPPRAPLAPFVHPPESLHGLPAPDLRQKRGGASAAGGPSLQPRLALQGCLKRRAGPETRLCPDLRPCAPPSPRLSTLRNHSVLDIANTRGVTSTVNLVSAKEWR